MHILTIPILIWDRRVIFKSIQRKSLLEDIQYKKLKYTSTMSFFLFLQ